MISRHLYEETVRTALREDAPFGDPFGESFQGAASGLFLAGGNGVLCGGPMASEVFRQVDPSVSVSISADGCRVAAGDRIGKAAGPACSLLRAERTALNFLQRLSGVATATNLYASRIAAHGTSRRRSRIRRDGRSVRVAHHPGCFLGDPSGASLS